MSMIEQQRLYQMGEVVELVDLARIGGPLEVPMIPTRWYMLRVHPNREFKVMKTFQRRNVSAWLPVLTSMQNVTRYRRGYEFLHRQSVVSPMVTGVIIIPDFEAEAERWRGIDGVIGLWRIDERPQYLRPKDVEDLRSIEAIGNTPKSKRARAFELGQLTRVTRGPFALFCGRVERFDSIGRLTVGVEIFGRITPVSLDESDVEAV